MNQHVNRKRIRGLHDLPDGLRAEDFEWADNAKLAQELKTWRHKWLNRQRKRCARIGRIVEQDKRMLAYEKEMERSRAETEAYVDRMTEAFLKAMQREKGPNSVRGTR